MRWFWSGTPCRLHGAPPSHPSTNEASFMNTWLCGGHLVPVIKERRGIKKGQFKSVRDIISLRGERDSVLKGQAQSSFCPYQARQQRRRKLSTRLFASFPAFFRTAPGAPSSRGQAGARLRAASVTARPAPLPSSLPRPFPTFLKGAGPREEPAPDVAREANFC